MRGFLLQWGQSAIGLDSAHLYGVNISQLPILHPKLMKVRILLISAKFHHFDDRSHINVDEVVRVDYFDAARFRHPDCTRGIRIVVAIGIHPTFSQLLTRVLCENLVPADFIGLAGFGAPCFRHEDPTPG